jgi:hypothetical protein
LRLKETSLTLHNYTLQLTTKMETKPPLPPFTIETAKAKVQAAEDAWNTRDPDRVALAYTEDSRWRQALQARPSVQQAVVNDYGSRLLGFLKRRNSYLATLIA